MGDFISNDPDIDYSAVQPAELRKSLSRLDPADASDRHVIRKIFLDTADARSARLLDKRSVEHLRTHFNRYGMTENHARKAKTYLLNKLEA